MSDSYTCALAAGNLRTPNLCRAKVSTQNLLPPTEVQAIWFSKQTKHEKNTETPPSATAIKTTHCKGTGYSTEKPPSKGRKKHKPRMNKWGCTDKGKKTITEETRKVRKKDKRLTQ